MLAANGVRPDFLDRAVIVKFLDLKPEMRRDEAQFWREFEEVRPRILGALIDAAAAGLRNLPNVRLDEPPRMADFAIWVNACEESLGMKPGEALTAYQSNRAETHMAHSRLLRNLSSEPEFGDGDWRRINGLVGGQSGDPATGCCLVSRIPPEKVSEYKRKLWNLRLFSAR